MQQTDIEIEALKKERDDLRRVAITLLEALKHARSQMQHPDQMIDEAITKAEETRL